MGHCLPYHPYQATAMKTPTKFLAYPLPGSDQSDQATHSGGEVIVPLPAASAKATAGATRAASSQCGRNNSTAKVQYSCLPAKSLSATPNRVGEARATATSATQANGQNEASHLAWEPATPRSRRLKVPQAATSYRPFSAHALAAAPTLKAAASACKNAEAKVNARAHRAKCGRIVWPSSTTRCRNRETETRRYRPGSPNGES
jgi:hypothetical protein